MTDNGMLVTSLETVYAEPFEATSRSLNDRSSGNVSVTLPIDQLVCVSSPRLTGLNSTHARLLADLHESLPPIVVQRSTMRVVDGMHRLEAARIRGDRCIEATFVNYTDAEAFVAAVKLNSAHGLPLSAEERSAATRRILESYPAWSDRRIASICGVAPRTVAAIRRSSGDDGQQLNTRLGRDGRLHPVSAGEGRRVAAEYMQRHPEATLREIAQAASISIGTTIDVRRKFRQASNGSNAGQAKFSAVPEYQSSEKKQAAKSTNPPGDLLRDISVKLSTLTRDPSLRYTQQGRALLRLVYATLAYTAQPEAAARNLPSHCRETVSDVARACADRWQELAGALASHNARA